ncbi:efflux transporter periplasmic adaptor subunit [Nibricoccus aquaticus]|uniref:Efflux transporter periplasmic adaptor subunit n=1 Tax=Nibricoccus aquaticus TaxID=2576891 RepID=A0A290QAR1_9BACT|nr:efflux RND transporter periplasmic adaptor subunit [Nibricoccus aquaticus]ATC65523.1 efflux transporter periplasmic adaptor subunit [Nibricoccus aquaticus]
MLETRTLCLHRSSMRVYVSRYLPVALFSTLLIFNGCKKPSAQRAGAPPVPVKVAAVTQRDVPVTRAAVGVVQPLHTVSILSQVEGVLTKVHFREGDNVKAGDLLVTLDQRPFLAASRSAEAQLAQARANFEKASADLERYTKLHEQKAVSDTDFSQYTNVATSARASVAVQEAAAATTKLNLDYTEIRAPIDGRTSRLALREGSLVRANDASTPLLTINQLAPIGMNFSLPEVDLDAVQSALKAGKVTVEARKPSDAKRVWTGELDFVDNTVGLNTGTIALRANFANEDAQLWPGQFVTLSIKIGEQPGAFLVPATAVVDGQQGSQVFVVKPDNTIEVRLIHPGITSGNEVVIDGVKAGETVVTDGQLRLLSGSKVVVSGAGNGGGKQKPADAVATKSEAKPSAQP